MNNATILIKVRNRLNKISSNDYTNLDSWAIVEAFNKGQIQWCRRNLHGTNAKQEGDQESISRISDFEQLVVFSPDLIFTHNDLYDETSVSKWPADYLRWIRIAMRSTKECCSEPKRMKVYLGIESDVDDYLSDINLRPNYDWGETFAIISGHKIRIYHDNKFDINDAQFIYYRQPRRIQITGVTDLNTNTTPSVDVECEFSEDLIELLVDEAAKILAFDTNNFQQGQRLGTEVETNN